MLFGYVFFFFFKIVFHVTDFLVMPLFCFCFAGAFKKDICRIIVSLSEFSKRPVHSVQDAHAVRVKGGGGGRGA